MKKNKNSKTHNKKMLKKARIAHESLATCADLFPMRSLNNKDGMGGRAKVKITKQRRGQQLRRSLHTYKTIHVQSHRSIGQMFFHGPLEL
jgi:hypothetical protein